MKKTISFIIAFGILSLFASCKESLNTSTSEMKAQVLFHQKVALL